MDDFLVRLEKQVWAVWLPIITTAALSLGFALGTCLPTRGRQLWKHQERLKHNRGSQPHWVFRVISAKSNCNLGNFRALSLLARIASNWNVLKLLRSR